MSSAWGAVPLDTLFRYMILPIFLPARKKQADAGSEESTNLSLSLIRERALNCCGLCCLQDCRLCRAHGEPSNGGRSDSDSTGCLRKVVEIMKDISHPELRMCHLWPSDWHVESTHTQREERKEVCTQTLRGPFSSTFTGYLKYVQYKWADLQISQITKDKNLNAF